MKKSSGNLITGMSTNPYFAPFGIWNMNKILLLVLCIFSSNILYAQNDDSDLSDTSSTVNIDGLLYYLSENSHTAMLANQNSWEGELVIPEQVTYKEQKYTVNKIEWLAFFLCKTLTKVSIPKTVTDIQHYAGFDDCKNPFDGCTSLEAIEVDEENPSMCSVDGVLFSKDKSRLYCYPAGARATKYNVPDGVTWICGDAFAYNAYLGTVTIPNSVTYMSYGVFGSCSNLKSVKLSESLKYLDAYTFEKCESLRVLDIPQSVSGFAESVFRWTNIEALVVRGLFPGNLRSDTFYFVSDSMIIYAQTSEISKFKRVFSGTVLPLEEYDASIYTPVNSISTLHNKEGALYDLSGRPLHDKPSRGIYIEDGKKIMIK